jgi:hypothetical protein
VHELAVTPEALLVVIFLALAAAAWLAVGDGR